MESTVRTSSISSVLDGYGTLQSPRSTPIDRARVAKLAKEDDRLPQRPKVLASCETMGQCYGVGIGLWFKSLHWLRWLVAWLAVASIPYLVMIHISKFAPSPALPSATAVEGVSVFGGRPSLFSFTLAGLVDESKDNNTLPWMQYMVAGSAVVHSVKKEHFLLWVAVVDAASIAVFIVVALVLNSYWAGTFCQQVDENTVEVADYTVLVRGLPHDATIHEIGNYFSRFGQVMDVVACTEFGPLLSLAGRATALEEARRGAALKVAQTNSVTARKRAADAEVELKKLLLEAEERKRPKLRAAFVTFNMEEERQNCMVQCPCSWRSTWWRQRHSSQRFNGKHRFWVQEACPPEDYLYENLGVGSTNRFLRCTCLRVLVLVVLLACALAVTALMSVNTQFQHTIAWLTGGLEEGLTAAMAATPGGGGGDSTVVAVVGSEATTAYCTEQLAGHCQGMLSEYIGTEVRMEFGQLVAWDTASQQFVKSRQLYTFMHKCTLQGGSCMLSACYPCYCEGLRQAYDSYSADKGSVMSAKTQCAAYIDSYDVKTLGIKSAISVVIVVLNMLLKAMLQVMVGFEKHVTKSASERAYAYLAFGSQLLNSVLVLLLVNAKFDQARAAINAGLLGESHQIWFQNIILSGPYPDFTTSWYEDVGYSIIFIAIISVVMQPGFYLMYLLLRKGQQWYLTSCGGSSAQDAYNAAWAGWEFALDTRVSDAMLYMTLTLLFGSGMPLLYFIGIAYLILLDLIDRHMLVRMCKTPVRYNEKLPRLLLALMPWAALAHCCFGLWMHTYFRTETQQLLTAWIPGLAGNSTLPADSRSDLGALTASALWARVSQTNGLPLLILVVTGVVVLILMRAIVLGLFCSIFEQMCGCKLLACVASDPLMDRRVSYASALSSPSQPLKGAPTFRLPHHPRYKARFCNALYLPIWHRLFGSAAYTRVRSLKGGRFEVAPFLLLEEDTSNLEEELAELPPDIRDLACALSGLKAAPALAQRLSTLRIQATAGFDLSTEDEGGAGGSGTGGGGAGGCSSSGGASGSNTPGRVPSNSSIDGAVGWAGGQPVQASRPSSTTPGSPRASLLPPTWPSSGADGGSLSPGAGMRPTPSPTRFAAGQYPGLPGGGGFESSAGSLVGAAMTGAPDVVLMQRLPDGSYVRHSYTPVPAAALHLMGLGPSSPPPPGSGSPMGAAGSAAPGYAAYMQQGPPQPPQLQRQPSLAQALGSFAQPPSQGWASPGRTSAAPSSFGMDGWGGAGEAGQPLAGMPPMGPPMGLQPLPYAHMDASSAPAAILTGAYLEPGWSQGLDPGDAPSAPPYPMMPGLQEEGAPLPPMQQQPAQGSYPMVEAPGGGSSSSNSSDGEGREGKAASKQKRKNRNKKKH